MTISFIIVSEHNKQKLSTENFGYKLYFAHGTNIDTLIQRFWAKIFSIFTYSPSTGRNSPVLIYNILMRDFMLLFSKGNRLYSYIIIIELIIMVTLLYFLFLSTESKHHFGKRIIVVNNGLIYQKGESQPFTGRILDTLQKTIIIEYDVVNGIKNGEFFLSNLDGIYTVYGFINNNKNVGTWHYYYDDGQLECTGDFNDDKPTGKWIWYHKNGVKKSEGFYIDGRPQGKWTQYDRDGYPSLIINYRDGELLSSVKITKPALI